MHQEMLDTADNNTKGITRFLCGVYHVYMYVGKENAC